MSLYNQSQPQVQRMNEDYEEFGRTYGGYRRGMYMYPIDEDEKDRMDLNHKLIYEIARSNVLHNAPIMRPDARIMDLGCGTGIWAIDMADKFTHAEVVGVDLANIQPRSIPPNLRFRVPRDYEAANWAIGEDSFDLIHVQQACGSVADWPELLQKIYRHCLPGQGYVELVEFDLEPRCDDGSLPTGSALNTWYQHLVHATAMASRPINYPHQMRRLLMEAGFIDIQEVVIRCPYDTWPTDTRQRNIGKWYKVSMDDGLEAWTLAPILRQFSPAWQPSHVSHLLSEVRKDLSNRNCHGYNNLHIWTARRPQ